MKMVSVACIIMLNLCIFHAIFFAINLTTGVHSILVLFREATGQVFVAVVCQIC